MNSKLLLTFLFFIHTIQAVEKWPLKQNYTSNLTQHQGGKKQTHQKVLAELQQRLGKQKNTKQNRTAEQQNEIAKQEEQREAQEVEKQAWREEEAELRKVVLEGYEKEVRPFAPNLTISITSLVISHLLVNEHQQTLVVEGRLLMSWEDHRLTWSLADHMNLDRLGVDPTDLWRPDLALPPSKTGQSSVVAHSQLPALVYPNGDISVVPEVRLVLECDEDLTLWPQDLLTCSTVIGSWIHEGHMLNFSLEDYALKLEVPAGGGWVVTKRNLSIQQQHHPCCSDPRTFISLELFLRRHAPTFAWVVKTPIVCLTLLCWVVFLLPPAAGEKVVVGVLNLALHLLYLALTSPFFIHATNTTPFIVQLAIQGVVLAGMSVVVSVVVVRISRLPHSSPLPSFITSTLISLASVLCLSSYARQVKAPRYDYAIILKGEDDGGEGGAEGDRPSYQPQWLLLAASIDRLALLIYLSTCIITLLCYSSVL